MLFVNNQMLFTSVEVSITGENQLKAKWSENTEFLLMDMP